MSPSTSVMMSKVLVIEDSDIVRLSFVLAFEDEGYEVYSAHDGRSGLERFTECSPDIVLTDLRMPDIDGIDVISEIRKTSSVPVIVVSAIGDPQTKDACLQAGANDYVVKGNSVDELMLRVAEHLNRPG